jgi:hypothetical protein
MHHHVDVVEQHPPPGPLALAPHRLGLLRKAHQALLDRVHDRLHLPLVGCGGDHERIGDDHLLGHVDDDDVVRLLVGGGLGGAQRQLTGALGCSHSPSLSYDATGRSWIIRTNYR